MKTLLKREETYRVETETARDELIAQMKKQEGYYLVAVNHVYKEKKPTKANPDGDSYYIVKFKVEYCKENAPTRAEY